MKGVAAASLVGSALEWFDYFLYGTAAALVFNEIMFPKGHHFVSTILAFSTLALGFVVRPFGAIYFGQLGDKIGRKKVLVITLLLMGSATTLIGFVPGYDSVGVWAPIMLVILRLIQGFGAGAEFGGAAILTAESAPANKRGFYSSFPGVGVYIGLLLSAGTFAVLTQLPKDIFLGWAWRIPFLFSALLVAVALTIRMKLSETAAFEKLAESGAVSKSPLRDLVKTEKKSLFVVAGSQVAQSGVSYVYQTFVIAYIVGTLHMAPSVGPVAVAVAAAFAMFTTPMFGALSDKFGRKAIYMFGAVFSALFAFPFFWLVNTGTVWGVIVAMTLGVGIGVAAMLGTQGAFFSEVFPSKVRFSGLALGREISAAASGGIAPLAAVLLSGMAEGASWPVACLAVVMSVITMIAVGFAPETHQLDLTQFSSSEEKNSAAESHSFNKADSKRLV
ncbi:MFS transporter [Erwinia typographi]|uniref:MFS transporter n=1 Tax=Erwinia typographi TaxID=371042 RepID=UPI0018DD0482|nr:MFS transporter [Erwinia typographi]